MFPDKVKRLQLIYEEKTTQEQDCSSLNMFIENLPLK